MSNSRSHLFINPEYHKGVLILIVLISSLFAFHYLHKDDCASRISYANIHVNDDINLDSLFMPPDMFELAEIMDDWHAFNSKSESYKIVKEYPLYPERRLMIVEHIAEGRKHYGTILFPYQYDESKKYPLMLWAAGLGQSNPRVDIIQTPMKRYPKDYFIVIPSYRGQSLVVDGKSYCSDGFFGDAFDGATDDAIRLLELTKQEFKGVDLERIAVSGGSRGGTVALLMATRDTTINVCVSMAGPVDFLNRDPYNRYGRQFKYQFLNERKPMRELRAKMLKSSPIYFIENYSNALFIVHGKNDEVVPLLNAERVIEKFNEKDNFEYFLAESGHIVPEMKRVIEWVKKYNH